MVFPAASPGPVDHRQVDLRSDAVTRPRPEMWEAMRSDPLDWSHDGDATVAELERQVADLVGKPAALFVPTGTMANALAAAVLARPGDRFVVDRTAHVLRSEGLSYQRIAGLEPYLVDGVRGHPTAAHLAEALAQSDTVSLLWLENTHTFAGGTLAAYQQDREMALAARDAGVRIHLDGARLWNAAVAGDRSMADLASVADTVTLNLTKGLGCPAGSILCGQPDVIDAARELALALGGFVAQAGLLAAAGLVSLRGFETAIARDHELAARLADGLRDAGVAVGEPETNIVLARVQDAVVVRDRLAVHGVLVFVRDPSTIRFVTHREIDPADIDHVVTMAGLLTDAGATEMRNPND